MQYEWTRYFFFVYITLMFIIVFSVDYFAPMCNECAILLRHWLVGMIDFVCVHVILNLRQYVYFGIV